MQSSTAEAQRSRGAGGFLQRLGVWRRPDQRNEVIHALDAHAPVILGAALRVLGELADAEDVAQDVAEKLLRSPPASVSNWPAFLKRIAVNASIDRLRRQRFQVGEPVEQVLIDPSGAPDERVANEQRAHALRRAVAELPDRDARLFSLYCFADLTHAEIGVELGLTANAVGVAVHRLKDRLSRALAERLGDPESGVSRT